MYLVQNEKGPRGRSVPKGPRYHLTRTGIPAPLFCRREFPVNRAAEYPAVANCVKAILPLSPEGHTEYRGDFAASGGTVVGVDLSLA